MQGFNRHSGIFGLSDEHDINRDITPLKKCEAQECANGKVPYSNCCGAQMSGVMTDYMICPDCKEHCDLADCEECVNGFIEEN